MHYSRDQLSGSLRSKLHHHTRATPGELSVTKDTADAHAHGHWIDISIISIGFRHTYTVVVGRVLVAIG